MWPESVFSLAVPFLLSCFYLARAWRHVRRDHIALFVLSILGSYLVSWWDVTPETVSLHIIPVFFIALAFANYRHARSWDPGLAFAGMFFSLMTVDAAKAHEMIVQTGQDLSMLRHLGGAGMGDGLFLFPFASLLLQFYVQRRTLSREPAAVAIT